MEQKAEYITEAEIEEGLSILKGDAVIQFEKPSEQIVETEQGFEVVQSLGWVKFSAAFRKNMLKKLKGAKLAIFICVSLHLNEDGFSFPGIDKIAEETDYNRDTVMQAIAEMEDIPGLLSVLRERGKANIYRPAFVARGSKSDPDQPVGKIRLVGQPVQKSITGLETTSLENLDSKERKELKRGDSLDGIIHYQLKPKGIRDAFAKHFRLTPNWEAKYNRQFLEWLVEVDATPEQIKKAAELWKIDKRFNWKVPTLKGIQEHWMELTEVLDEPKDTRKPLPTFVNGKMVTQ